MVNPEKASFFINFHPPEPTPIPIHTPFGSHAPKQTREPHRFVSAIHRRARSIKRAHTDTTLVHTQQYRQFFSRVRATALGRARRLVCARINLPRVLLLALMARKRERETRARLRINDFRGLRLLAGFSGGFAGSLFSFYTRCGELFRELEVSWVLFWCGRSRGVGNR